MAKTKLYGMDGSVKGDIEVPKCFDSTIREDIIKKVFLNTERRQAYGPNLTAGSMYSASGVFHQTQGRKYKTKKGLGISRVPRKIMSSRGTRISRVGASIPGARGGREAHPPKAIRQWTGAINKKERVMALNGLIAATGSFDKLQAYYPKTDFSKISLPIVVEEKFVEQNKTKKIKEAVEKVLGSAKTILGRNRILIVSDKVPKITHSEFDFAGAHELNVLALAPSGKPGRLVIYTDGALAKLKNRIK